MPEPKPVPEPVPKPVPVPARTRLAPLLALALCGCTLTASALVSRCAGDEDEPSASAPAEPTESPTPVPDPTDAAPAPAPAEAEQAPTTPAKGKWLADMTWLEAEAALTPDTVVVIPVGASSKEHGPHLPLRNDQTIAEYHADRVVRDADVVMAPLLGHHFYPAFTAYPGSITLRRSTARDLVVDVVRSLAGYGPRRFYVLNTGVSTVGPLRDAQAVLAAEGIALTYTDLPKILGEVERSIAEQPGGTHADEIETSMMLYIAPDTVDMSKAVDDWAPKSVRGFSRTPDGPGHYSKSGVWGNATLATRDKGERVVETMAAGVLEDIERLRASPLPEGTPQPATDYPFGAPLPGAKSPGPKRPSK